MNKAFANEEIEKLRGRILFNKYITTKLIGVGAFGIVLQGINTKTNEGVAIKIEKKTGKDYLETECNYLMSVQGYGIPKVKSFGITRNFYILITELLGKSLFDIKDSICLKDACIIGLQIIDRLEFIHSKYIIHRDIKPANFLLKNNSIVYLIDFGSAKKYRSSTTKKHIKFENLKRIVGTPEFLSLNANIGYSQSRRDDLESLGYLLIFLIKGKLPWNFDEPNINPLTKIDKIWRIKKSIKPEKLCEDLPSEFSEYIKYCKNLKFEEGPNYEYLRGLFKNVIIANNLVLDIKFSWNKTKENENSNKYPTSNDIFEKINKTNPTNRKTSPLNRIYKKIKEDLFYKKFHKNMTPEKLSDNNVSISNRNITYSEIKNLNKLHKDDNNFLICNINNQKVFDVVNVSTRNYYNPIFLSKTFANYSLYNDKKVDESEKKLNKKILNKSKTLKEKISYFKQPDISQLNNIRKRNSVINFYTNEDINKSNLKYINDSLGELNKSKKLYFSKAVYNIKLEYYNLHKNYQIDRRNTNIQKTNNNFNDNNYNNISKSFKNSPNVRYISKILDYNKVQTTNKIPYWKLKAIGRLKNNNINIKKKNIPYNNSFQKNEANLKNTFIC